MASQGPPAWRTIKASQFQDALQAYDPLIQSISESKGAKAGQSTLLHLDRYRYGKALGFASAKAGSSITAADVEKLVEWKLRHGQFRPTLMKLVQSNESAAVESIIHDAIRDYQKDEDVPAAITKIARLKGIGPATASLLLAVHDPDKVAFFADEAFHWLCCAGRKDQIKYNAKEYAKLDEHAKQLAARLGVKAVDVERVAFVAMREPSAIMTSASAGTDEPKAEKPQKVSSASMPASGPTKRKQSSEETKGAAASPRRSKRGKTTSDA